MANQAGKIAPQVYSPVEAVRAFDTPSPIVDTTEMSDQYLQKKIMEESFGCTEGPGAIANWF